MRILSAVAVLAVLATPALAKAPTLHVQGWARATIAGQNGSAAYLTIHNAGPGADRLLAVTTPTAASATLHNSTSVGGVMRMRGAGPQAIAHGQLLRMRSGGLHVMLNGVKAPLRAGARLPLTLRFERAGLVRTSVPIQMSAPHAGHAH
ncbi:MAG TPA: copper chaperone PCu(A)C [Sphingomicrobium sp.]|jgi:copper(I)-binding protein|nr:copper chaperone PCu(A)C [Sphingomicrobium sp.]